MEIMPCMRWYVGVNWMAFEWVFVYDVKESNRMILKCDMNILSKIEYFTVIIDVAYTNTKYRNTYMYARIQPVYENNGKRLQRTFSLDNFSFGVECFCYLIGFFQTYSKSILARLTVALVEYFGREWND